MLRIISFVCLFCLMTLPLLAHEKEPFFEDKFQGELKEGWSWLRENPKGHRFVDKTLEVLMEPFSGDESRNVLLRSAPDRRAGAYQFELSLETPFAFENQYQQVGLFWMQGEKTALKFVREFIDGELYVFPGKVPIKGNEIFMRLTVNGENVKAEFKTDAKDEYKPAFEGKLPTYNEGEKIGIQCWHGLPDKEHWVKLRHFKIFKMD